MHTLVTANEENATTTFFSLRTSESFTNAPDVDAMVHLGASEPAYLGSTVVIHGVQLIRKARQADADPLATDRSQKSLRLADVENTSIV